MALHLRDNFSDEVQELMHRYEALKKAGFDEDTANMYARICSSVNEAIDAILSRSLSASEISDLRASYGKNFSNFSAHNLSLPSHSAPNNTTNVSTNPMSSIFLSKNFNTSNISGSNSSNAFSSNGSNSNSSACDSLGLKLISDIDNCLGSILDSDNDLPQQNSNIFFNNNNKLKQQTTSGNMIIGDEEVVNSSATNKICDSISCDDNLLLNRSLSPSHFFGIDYMKPKQTNTTSNNSFSIDLNKHTLGSHIVPNHFGRDGSGSGSNFSRNNGISMTSFLNPPKKTFADIASTNTKKAVQPPKTLSQAINARTLTNIQQCFDNNNISNNNTSNKEIVISKPLKVSGDTGNKLSSLESFSAPNSNANTNGKVSPNVFSANEPTKPTNIMAYKGLWVCNISPEASYVTLKKIFRKYGNFTGLQTFERKATNGSNIVFVHYDNAQSPTDAIAELFGIYRKDICIDEITPLKLRFTPSMEQTKSGDLPTMEKAKRVVEKTGECFNWRLSSGCHKGERCNFKHIPINKSVDSQPWVKALKKKTNEI